MAEYSFPYDAVEDAQGEPDRVYYAEDFRRVFKAFFTNGLLPNPSTNLQVLSLHSNMVVTVQPGVAHVNGATYTNDEPIEFAVDTANANYNRLDLIVLRLDETERTCHVYYRAGTPSGNPQEPELNRTADAWELKLAKIMVRSGTQVINQSDITDTRLDTDVCGIVAAIPDHVDTTTIFNQYSNAWEQVKATMAANEAAYNAWYETFKASANADMARINQDFADKMQEINSWEQAEIAKFDKMYQDNQAEFDVWLAEFKAAADAKLQEQYDRWSAAMTDYNAWYASIKNAIFDAKYFDFDNNVYRADHEYSYTETKEPHVFIETIKNSLNNEVYAVRTSEESTSGDWTIRTVCTEQSISLLEQWQKQADGTWKGVFNNA